MGNLRSEIEFKPTAITVLTSILARAVDEEGDQRERETEIRRREAQKAEQMKTVLKPFSLQISGVE